jgi:hypothetical protein
MKKNLLFIYLSTFIFIYTPSAIAEVFMWLDENGNKVYGDEPQKADKAQKVELKPITVLSFPENKNDTTDSVDTAPLSTINHYNAFTISTPSNDETIRDNTGNVQVTLQVEPALMKGHSIQVYIDSSAQSSPQTSADILLKDINRGTHTLMAKLLDENGKVLMQSKSTTFYLHQQFVKNAKP